MWVDESGGYLWPGVASTYALCGPTPLVHCWLTRDHLSVMSGMTMSGARYTMVRTATLTSADSVRFLKQLCSRRGRKLLVIWDGSPIHKGEVHTFLHKGGAKPGQLVRLPGYAPELNPTEGVWQQRKHVELRTACGIAHCLLCRFATSSP